MAGSPRHAHKGKPADDGFIPIATGKYIGAVTLASDSQAVKVGKGSAMLLRVDGSGPEEARATRPFREKQDSNAFAGLRRSSFRPAMSRRSPAVHFSSP